MTFDVSNQIILITGAARGLGKAYADVLAAHGAKIILHDGGVNADGGDPDETIATAAAEEINQRGGEAIPATMVLDGQEACAQLVAFAVERFGRLDALIHNAGIVRWTDPADVDEGEFAAMNSVNNEAAFWLCAAALPHMRAQGYGRIVLTTSGWALGPNRGSDRLVLYCHGKGAQLGLGLGLANAAGDDNIYTNLISPVANTRMYAGDVPEGKLLPESVAGIVAWLASPACSVTGKIIDARDNTLSIYEVTKSDALDLGAGATDPVACGKAIEEILLSSST